MIAGIAKRIESVIDDNTVCFLDIDTDKIAAYTRHLARIPARDTQSIAAKLGTLAMLCDCEEIACHRCLEAWKNGDQSVMLANTIQMMIEIRQAADEAIVDPAWFELFESVVMDLNRYALVTYPQARG
jgi:hypothetical protein